MTRRVKRRAVDKESVRDTAWATSPANDDHDSRPPCPQCGGELLPVDDYSDLLDPKLICISCHALWPDLNTLQHQFAAMVVGKRMPRRQRVDSRWARQREWMLWLTVASGLIVLLTMITSWIQFERGVCTGCDVFDYYDWDEIAETGARRLRIMVPVVGVYWGWLLVNLIRTRENTTRTAVGFLVWILVVLISCVIV